MILSSHVPIRFIDIQVFVHATEDQDKVLTAIKNVLPEELMDKVAFEKTNLKGHHGNPITLLKAKIKEKNAVKTIFEKISSGLNSVDKELLKNEIDRHLDRGNLYIRLDKQSAYLNELKICSTDPIHLRIHFKKHRPEEIMDICREFGMLP